MVELVLWLFWTHIYLFKGIVIPGYRASLMLRKSNFNSWEISYLELLNSSDELLSFTSFSPIEELSADSLLIINPVLFDDLINI